MSTYMISGEITTDRARSMDAVTNVICNALERAFGVTEEDYYVRVDGPPELSLRVRRS